jgi:hypothetical protein
MFVRYLMTLTAERACALALDQAFHYIRYILSSKAEYIKSDLHRVVEIFIDARDNAEPCKPHQSDTEMDLDR